MALEGAAALLTSLFGTGGTTTSGGGSSSGTSTGTEASNSETGTIASKNATSTGTTATSGAQYQNQYQGTNSNLTTSGTTRTSGTSTTVNSGSVNTTKLDISQTGIDSMVNDLMSANDGLRSVTSGAHVSGMYGDTVQTQLANDLVSRIVGKVAAATGTTTQTIGGSTSTTQQDQTTQTNQTQTGSQTSSLIGTNYNNTNATSNTANTENDITHAVTNTNDAAIKNQSTVTQQQQQQQQGGLLPGWVICTELYKQKKLPYKYYRYGSLAFLKLPAIVQRGYHFWAVPYVRLMRKSTLATSLVTAIFNWRAENIAASYKVKGARKLLRGAAVTVILYPLCFLVGLFVTKQNYSSLYVKGN